MSRAGTPRPPKAPPHREASYDVERLRRDFPALALRPRGKPLVYLDNAATTQKPRCVIERLVRYYEEENANVHRGLHFLSVRATEAYEGVREQVRAFLGAASAREIVFTRGTTEAINLVAWAYGGEHLRRGDEVLITGLEHHSNIVPWQLLGEERGVRLKVARLTPAGDVDLDHFRDQLGPRTKLVAVAHMANALGTVNPVAEMIRLAHKRGVPVLLDGAQAAAHLPVDVQALGCDFYTFSGHKIYGPTGAGVLYGKLPLLEAMRPYQGGGEMIARVTFDRTTYNQVPHKFEAGTPDIAAVVGLGAALDYVGRIGLEAIARHEAELVAYARSRLRAVPGLRFIGTPRHQAGIVSFVLEGIHPHDAGTILDLEGVAVRAGHHCAQPVMDHFGVPATVRVSFGLYNTPAEVDRLVGGLYKVVEVLGR